MKPGFEPVRRAPFPEKILVPPKTGEVITYTVDNASLLRYTLSMEAITDDYLAELYTDIYGDDYYRPVFEYWVKEMHRNSVFRDYEFSKLRPAIPLVWIDDDGYINVNDRNNPPIFHKLQAQHNAAVNFYVHGKLDGDF